MDKQLRVIIFKDGDLFIAQCLEYDVAAQGRTEEEAQERLEVALRAEAREAKEAGKTLDPAPAMFHAIYQSNDISRTEVTLAAA